MAKTDAPVLVTGITGFIGMHCALALLEDGWRVRGTLRDLARGEEVRAALAALAGEAGRLALVEAVPSPASSDRSTETLALRALRLTAEAHARAARGDEPGARRALDAIRAITPAALDFARQPRGPASDLADQM